MQTIQTNYQALVTEEDIPNESVIFHAASEGGKPHWNHIGDLDTFFTNVYIYHQSHGFRSIMFRQCRKTLYLFAIIFGLLYILNGVNINFDEYPSPLANKTHVELPDLFLSVPECLKYFGTGSWIILIVGILAMLWKCYKLWQTYTTFDDIRHFYTSAMKIEEHKLSHITWHEVQSRLREVQHEQQMCVHKSDLTELDISHRILRQTNYIVAMMNKNILPIKLNIKCWGQWVYFTVAMEYILNLLFFSRISPVFKETGKLHDDYKRYTKRKEAAANLERMITVSTVILAVLTPFSMIFGIGSFFIQYSGYVRFSPNLLSARQWSRFSRYHLRHFNELDHELQSRLARAYKPANNYMKSFSSHLTVLIARTLCQIVGSLAVLLICWGLINEKLFSVPGVLILLSICSIIFISSNALIPDENAVYLRTLLMKKILSEIHYVPDNFERDAELPIVRDLFSQLLQYKFVALAEELFGFVMIPYILYAHIRPRALDIVDFFRNFTVEVSGVGDVCSFALMDVSRHGNNQWFSGVHTKVDQHQQAEDGKTELSLVHFALMNPHWKPPPASDVFMNDFKQKVNIAREGQDIEDPYYSSLNSLSSIDSKFANLVNSIHHSHPLRATNYFPMAQGEADDMGVMTGGGSLAEGPPYLTRGGFLSNIHGAGGAESLHDDSTILNPLEVRVADMSFSALYLHEVHKRQNESSISPAIHPRQPSQELEHNENEASPLLEMNVGNYVQ